MANFQNVGTTNAGTFTVNNAGAALPGGTPTMDAAAIQSGNAFLTSELEKRDPLIRKVWQAAPALLPSMAAVPTASLWCRPA